MGISCQIIKKGREIERVFDPQMKDSSLYRSALEESKDQSVALKVWATAYTPAFKLYYGDWVSRNEEEPSLSDVKGYLEARQGIAPPLTDKDISDIRSLMVSTGIRTMGELNGAIEPFLRNGTVKVDRKSLIESGLYSVDEINNILNNPAARDNLVALMSKFNSMMLGAPNARMTYLLSNDYEGNIDSMTSEYNTSGKKQYISPAKIDSELMDMVGGIKLRDEFDAAMASLPYESVSERYFNDNEYADRIFEHYSSFTKLDVVDFSGRKVGNTERRNLIDYPPIYNEKVAGEMLEDMNALIEMPVELWGDENLVKEGLRKIALAGADMGLDLTELENQYGNKTKEEFEDFLLGLDVYIRSLKPGRVIDAFFVDDYDKFFEREGTKQSLAVLRPGEEKLNVVIMSPGTIMSDAEIYEEGSMMHLHDNVYQKVERMPKDRLYNVLYEMSLIDPKMLPQDAYPGKSGKATGFSRDSVIQSMREYVSKQIDFDQTEEIILNKLVFGHPLKEVKQKQDMQRDLNRYVERKSMDRPVDAFEIRSKLLRYKITDPQLYNNVLYNIVYDNGGFSLKNSDPMSLRDMELLLPKDIKDLLYDYALNSNEPTLHDLFFIKDYPGIYKTIDFYRDYYKNNPDAIEDMTFEYTSVPGEGNFIKTVAVDDIIRIKDTLYEKVAEEEGHSVFKPIYKVGQSALEANIYETEVSSNAVVLNKYDRSITDEESDKVKYDDYNRKEIDDIKERRTC